MHLHSYESYVETCGYTSEKITISKCGGGVQSGNRFFSFVRACVRVTFAREDQMGGEVKELE